MEGIRYRGLTLDECNERLPRAPGSSIALPEATFWFLLTGDIPTQAQADALSEELRKQGDLPQHVINTIDNLPRDMHAMTQLSIGLLALQSESQFHKVYSSGNFKKTELWQYALDDSVTLMAKIAPLAARIFRNQYFDGKQIAASDMDWAANYAHMLGVNDSEEFKKVILIMSKSHFQFLFSDKMFFFFDF